MVKLVNEVVALLATEVQLIQVGLVQTPLKKV